MCYAGATDQATTYFKHIGYECPHDTNPAEFFIDLVTVDTVSDAWTNISCSFQT
jgi:hypothetical protein